MKTARQVRFALTALIAAGILCNTPFAATRTALAQQACGTPEDYGSIHWDVKKLRSQLSDMSTGDRAVINSNFQLWTKIVKTLRERVANSLPAESLELKRELPIFEDALDFWREKKASLETGGMVDVQAGQRWSSYLHTGIDQLEGTIVGTWRWWNGLTVTFSPGGSASYRGSASGNGSWQRTGGNTFHAHWNAGNTDDYFTLSRDGREIEGKFDGKPGTSMRRC